MKGAWKMKTWKLRTARFRFAAPLGLGASFLWLAIAFDADAARFSLSPSTLSPSVGSSFALDLMVSELGSGVAPSIGAFNVKVAYDVSAIAFSGATFGPLLGVAPAGAIADAIPGAGAVELAEVSLLSPPALDALQPASFTLATLRFTAQTATASSIVLEPQPVLSDAFGSPLAVGGPPASATISATPPAAVPEPGALLLYGIGLVVTTRSWSYGRQRR
jgi:hypothetical protein